MKHRVVYVMSHHSPVLHTPERSRTVAFVWSSAFETGLGRVDEQHRGLVHLINLLGEQVASHRPTSQADLERHIAELRRYTVDHFTEEEQLMCSARVACAHREPHHRQHVYFVAELDRLATLSAAGQRDAAAEVLRFLASWLAYHILGIDQSMARQMARIDQGVSPESAHAMEQNRDNDSTKPLLDALDVLFHHLADRNEALRELNASLEHRVLTRTRELTAAMHRLERERSESQRLSEELAEANQRLETMAMTDVLSGLPNRRHALLQLDMAWEQSERGVPFAVILIDADDFKAINDTFGHDAGDEAIVSLGRTMRDAVRSDDVVCRMGGDEFLVFCPRTDLQGAQRVADAIWRAVGGMSVRFGVARWQGSVSVGVASRTGEMRGVADVIKAADDAVYRAKQGGRNRVVAAR